MSNLMEVIKSRRSTRAFKSELPPTGSDHADC